MAKETNLEQCYIYTRVSTDMQVEKYSLDAQKSEIEKYAKFHNIKIVGKYSDEGRSGKNVEGRPEFLKMMDDIESGKDNISYVIVFKLSRFGRNTRDILNSLETMQANEVNLISVMDGINSSNGVGKLMISLLGAVSEIELENIATQTMAGRKMKASSGLWNGGKPPYGYNLVKGKGILEVNEEEAKIVRVIYDKFVNENMAPDKISKYINEHFKRIPVQKHDKSLFTSNFVRKILDNETYCGYIVYGKTKSERDKKNKSKFHRVKNDNYIKTLGTHTPIVSAELWNVAHQKRQESKELHRKNRTCQTDHIYPLTGLIVCPECGSKMNGYCSSKKNPNKGGMYKTTYAYKCRNNKSQRGYICSFNRQLNEEAMCKAIMEIIKKISSNEKFRDLISEKIGTSIDVSELQQQKLDYEKNSRSVKRTIENLGNQIDNLDLEDELYAMQSDDLNSRRINLMKRLLELQKDIEEIDRKISTIKKNQLSRDTIYTILLNFDKFFEKLDVEEKKKCLHEMIDSIEIRNDLGAGKQGKLNYSNIITSVKFNFPINISDNKLTDIYLTNENDVETVCLLSRKEK